MTVDDAVIDVLETVAEVDSVLLVDVVVAADMLGGDGVALDMTLEEVESEAGASLSDSGGTKIRDSHEIKC